MAKRKIDQRVEVGPVHVAVANLDRARAFYEGVLGFDVIERIGDAALFLTADGVRRHIGLNTWNGTSRPAAHAQHFALRYPTRAALADALRRLEAAKVPIEAATSYRTSEAIYLHDPDGNGLELFVELPRQDAERGDAARPAPVPLDLDVLRTFVEAEGASEAGTETRPSAMPEGMRGLLRDIRIRLLNLHKVLLEEAKAAYEMDRGRVPSNATLLQLVINDPWFAWLHPLSGLVVRIDEALRADAPATEADGDLLLDEVTRLLSPVQGPGEFARHYSEALQRQPSVVVAHAEVRRLLKQAR